MPSFFEVVGDEDDRPSSANAGVPGILPACRGGSEDRAPRTVRPSAGFSGSAATRGRGRRAAACRPDNFRRGSCSAWGLRPTCSSATRPRSRRSLAPTPFTLQPVGEHCATVLCGEECKMLEDHRHLLAAGLPQGSALQLAISVPSIRLELRWLDQTLIHNRTSGGFSWQESSMTKKISLPRQSKLTLLTPHVWPFLFVNLILGFTLGKQSVARESESFRKYLLQYLLPGSCCSYQLFNLYIRVVGRQKRSTTMED